MNDISFGRWMKQRRRALDLTQAALASMVGCTEGTIRFYEAERLRPSHQVAQRLAEYLQIPQEQRHVFLRAARERMQSDLERSLSCSRARQSGLPVPLTTLIGRRAPTARVRDLLQRDTVRLLTLVGAPGIGKTRLSIQAAGDLQPQFADGMVFVELAPIRDPAHVLPAIAQVLGVDDRTNRPLIHSVTSYLEARQLLLVLDNFEQVLPAAPVVNELLQAARYLKVLVTSRVPLQVYGEYVYDVPPLTLPEQSLTEPVEALIRYESIELFLARAQAVKSEFTLTEQNAKIIAALCLRLEGLPLAIELAAARVRTIPPAALLPGLASLLTLLVDGPRDVPPRHQTIRDAIAWSYDLLDPNEQRLFASLGVFVGGWTLAAATAVCCGPDCLDFDVRDGLLALVTQSLVRQSDRDDQSRYTMLETVREYALERLTASGEAEVLRARHAAYYLDLAEGQAAHAWGPQRKEWLEHLKLEHGNARAALQWLHQDREKGSADVITHTNQTLRLCVALAEFWRVHSPSEGRQWLEASLEAAQHAPLSLQQKALTSLGWLARERGDHVQALRYFEHALAHARQLDDVWTLGEALRGAGNTRILQGEYGVADECFRESLALARKASDTFGTIFSLWSLAEAAYIRGNIDHAAALLAESHQLVVTTGFLWGQAYVLHFSGQIARRQGDPLRATKLFQEGVAYLRVHGEWWLMAALLLEGFAGLEAAKDEPGRAACLFGAAEHTRRSLKDPPRPRYLQGDYERDLATCVQLDEATLQHVWTEGQAMTLDQAVAYALEAAG